MIRNMIQNLNFFAIDFDAPIAKALDWILSAISFLYGIWLIYDGHTKYGWLVIGLSFLGVAFAWWRPLPRFQRYLRGRFIKRRG